ncbi:hybrid sensor histidine kinase/response regulator [Pseudoxanthomonas composti]|nr:hybrid sensor histidine kinase/response regulator [Pseudoxanthomonas composti]
MSVSPWGGRLAGLSALMGALALVALVLGVLRVPGPWVLVAMPLCACAVVLAVLSSLRARALREQAETLQVRASMAESERDTLRKDLGRHSLLEAQLTQAKQAAESAVLAKGEFLATMSHEIRTPLNGIVPMLELLGNAPLGKDQRDMLATAMASSQQLLRIVDDILDYSKLEADKLELETTTFNLREVLDGVIQLMQRPAESRNLRLQLQLDPAVRLSVRGDPVRLRQVLTNLIGNAIKFTERGSVTLALRRLGETQQQHLLRFDVRDTGIGIPAEAQERLFRAFSQADASTTRLYGGTGLGLAICKRIVELAGGRIGVVSQPGRGSTFWFEIPLLKVIGDLQGTHANRLNAHVLVVSPDVQLCQRLRALLPGWGFGLACVESPQEALERLRGPGGEHIGWVLADLPRLGDSARALQRGLGRSQVSLVWLYGDQPVPEDLRADAAQIPRLSPNSALRAILTQQEFPTTAVEDEAATSVAPELPIGEPPAQPGEAGPPSPAQPHAAAPPLPAQAKAAHGPILLVEDNPINRAVAETMLRVLGHSCDHAENGALAIEKMSAKRYGLVLMDCQMPVLDGYSATRRWRQREAELPQLPRLPIVAMTANAMAGDRQRCLDAGMDDYLSKPVSREQLQACIGRWMQAGEAQGTPDQAHAIAPPDPSMPSAASAPPHTSPAQPAGDSPTSSPALPAASVPVAAPSLAAAPRSSVIQTPVLDTSVLDELFEVVGKETAKIVGLFLEDTPKLIAALEAAAAASDLAALRMPAHTLKSSAANLGAMTLSAAAQRIELGSRNGHLERPAVAVALVIAEFARARLALQAYLNRVGG